MVWSYVQRGQSRKKPINQRWEFMLVFFLSFLFFLDMTVSNAFFFLKSSVFLLKEKKKHYLWWFYYLFVYLSVLSLSFPLRNTLSTCSYSVACSFSSSSSFNLFILFFFLRPEKCLLWRLKLRCDAVVWTLVLQLLESKQTQHKNHLHKPTLNSR